MNAPLCPPANPTVGQWWGSCVWSGSRWVQSGAGGLRMVTQVFSGAGTYTYQPSPGLMTLTVECIGGGGAGGGVAGGPTAATDVGGGTEGWVQAGGGGGAGGYARKTLPAALVLGGVVVTIGAGGLGGVDQWGGGGGLTTFGAFCVASGGWGGGLGDPGNNLFGMAGAGAYPMYPAHGIGDVVGDGMPGLVGVNAWYIPPSQSERVEGVGIGGAGGTTALGGSGGWSYPAYPGLPGMGDFPGQAGGGGAGSTSSGATPTAGSNGADGICVVTEYCWGADDSVCNPWGGGCDDC